MPRGDIVGCLVRFNKVLMGDTPIPYSFECTTSVEDVERYEDIEWVAGAAVEALSDTVGAELGLGPGVHWEYIGRRFNLYAYPVVSSGTRIGELRVVEAGGLVVNVSGGLGAELGAVAPEAVKRLQESRVLRRGQVLEAVYLEPGGGEASAPGQVAVPRFIVYSVEGVQEIDAGSWRLVVRLGEDQVATYTYEELLRMSHELGNHVFHCVTGWSTGPRSWRGVALRELLEEIGATKKGEWLAARNHAGYATIVPLGTALDEGLLVTHVDGEPLQREHGFPARLFFPSLYGWKAAKWVTEIIILDRYEDGFWETLAYHERGLVAAEERFKIRNTAIASAKRLPRISRKLIPPGRGS